MNKPIGRKAYGSIPHLPGSRLGPGDHHCHDGHARICLERKRDNKDRIIIQEKLDGSCVAAARIGSKILALTRSGYLAHTSPYQQHQVWDQWVQYNQDRFMSILKDGERLVGEWLAQAHGTRYILPHDPFVAFDLMRGGERACFEEFESRTIGIFVNPRLIGEGPLGINQVLKEISESGHGAIDPVEGAVWRVERNGRVDFLAKYVRHDKQDGKYLEKVSGRSAVWNWQPSSTLPSQ